MVRVYGAFVLHAPPSAIGNRRLRTHQDVAANEASPTLCNSPLPGATQVPAVLDGNLMDAPAVQVALGRSLCALSRMAAHAVPDVIPYPRDPNDATLRYASGAVARVVAVVTAIAARYGQPHTKRALHVIAALRRDLPAAKHPNRSR